MLPGTLIADLFGASSRRVLEIVVRYTLLPAVLASLVDLDLHVWSQLAREPRGGAPLEMVVARQQSPAVGPVSHARGAVETPWAMPCSSGTNGTIRSLATHNTAPCTD